MWHPDEVFVKIGGERQYLWRAVDQDGDVIDILVQRYRNARAAKRFFRKLLKGLGRTASVRIVGIGSAIGAPPLSPGPRKEPITPPSFEFDPVPVMDLPHHSVRIASTGSTRVACRAGAKVAARVTARRTRLAPTRGKGSVGSIP